MMKQDNRPKGPRLYLRKRIGRTDAYIIRDTGQPDLATGTDDLQTAQRALANYILSKPIDGNAPNEPRDIRIGTCLAHYENNDVPQMHDPERARYALQRLRVFWSEMPVSQITRQSCAAYEKWRVTHPFTNALGRALPPPSRATIAKELRTLRAALRSAYEENHLTRVPHVHMPEIEHRMPHVPSWADIEVALQASTHEGCRRFIRIAAQTGTRKDRILRLQWQPNLAGGWIDTKSGWLHRARHGETITSKRATSCRIPGDLLEVCREWERDGCLWVCHHPDGRRMADVRKQLAAACDAGAVQPFTPHKLKHFAITKAINDGADPIQAAAYFATSVRTMQQHYYQNDPNRQQTLSDIMRIGEHRHETHQAAIGNDALPPHRPAR